MNTLNLIYYSPTGTTQKIVKEIAQNMGLKIESENNITKLSSELNAKIPDNSLTIIGLPVYGGRIPVPAIEKLGNIWSNQSPAVIIVVYGNRAYEDALLELNKIVSNCGFNVIAGAAFIGEHSFSSKEKPIAHERPDQQDLVKCRDFAQMITDKLNNKNINEITTPNIPGKHPYKERTQLPVGIHPETDSNLCNLCGSCAEICPTNAIKINTTIKTNGEWCTWCCACIKNCPSGARIFNNQTINVIKEKLFTNCSARKEPEYFV